MTAPTWGRSGSQGRIFSALLPHLAELTAFRRDLHQHPELGFEEVYTSRRVVEALRVCGVDEIYTGIGKTGVVAVVRGHSDHSGRVIGLRADMDALPLHERNDFAWTSSTPGLMHACGHDGHTAMLVGAARYLAATRRFDGTAVLIFQPGEEGYAGARAMIEDGLFERFPCDQVFAQHNSPEYPMGVIGVTPGPMQAAVDRFEIRVEGKGGHGARPHLSNDTVLASAHITAALQSVVARSVSAFDQAVVSVCSVQAGHPAAMSVMPGEATLVGTVRSYREAVQDTVEARIRAISESVAGAFGCTAQVVYERVYPATVNTVPEAEFAADVAVSLVGEAQVMRNMPPSMGGEDFAFMLQVKPGAYLRVGQATPGGASLHNDRYDFNDDILPLGAALHAALVEHAMPAVQS